LGGDEVEHLLHGRQGGQLLREVRVLRLQLGDPLGQEVDEFFQAVELGAHFDGIKLRAGNGYISLVVE